jgi:hypothetical protein
MNDSTVTPNKSLETTAIAPAVLSGSRGLAGDLDSPCLSFFR